MASAARSLEDVVLAASKTRLVWISGSAESNSEGIHHESCSFDSIRLDGLSWFGC